MVYLMFFTRTRSSWPRFTLIYCPKTIRIKLHNYTTRIGIVVCIYYICNINVYKRSHNFSTQKIVQMTFKSIISTLEYMYICVCEFMYVCMYIIYIQILVHNVHTVISYVCSLLYFVKCILLYNNIPCTQGVHLQSQYQRFFHK